MNTILSDYLQIWGFEDDAIVFGDGSIGFAVDVAPLDISTWATSQVNQLKERTIQFLNSLPVGVEYQFVQDIATGAIDELLPLTPADSAGTTVVQGAPIQGSDAIVQKMAKLRHERLQALSNEGKIPRHRLTLFVRKSQSKALLGKPGIFANQRKFEASARSALNFETQALARIRDDLVSALVQLGLSSRVLSTNEIFDLVYRQWNPARSVTSPDYDASDVRPFLLFTDAVIHERGFSLADYHYRVISLRNLPDGTFAGMAQAMRDLPFDSRLMLTFHLPEQAKELARLETQRRIAYSMVTGKRNGMADIESEAKLKDLEDLIEKMVAQGEKAFRFTLQVILRSRNERELDDHAAQTLMRLRELSSAEGMEETIAAFDIFSDLALPNARCNERIKQLKTSNLADFLPIFGPWPGHESPEIILRSRSGGIVKFDPFSRELTNFNQVISGGSGSGKSYLTNILLMQMLKRNPRIFIVDIGGSYKRLCEQFQGQYIAFGEGSDLSINPFDLAEAETEPSAQKIRFLVGLVELMTKEHDSKFLGKLEQSELEDAIARVYREYRNPKLTHLMEVLTAHELTEVQRIGKILKMWCGDRPYGKFIDRPTTMRLDRSMLSFDLKGLDTHPDLQAVCLFILTDLIWREIQRDRTSMKFVVFDECWKLLESDAGSAFIGEVFRTFRKYMASAIAISQSVDDFAKSKVSTAIMSNSSVKWILMQKGADQERLKEVLQLNDNEVALIESITQEKGVYSEAYLMAGDRRSIVSIESTPIEYWLATTDSRDIAKIESARKKKPNVSNLELLESLSSEFPTGAK